MLYLVCCVVLCCVILCCAVLYCVVLCCTVLCCIVLYCAVLYCVMLCCIVLCFVVLCCTVLCCIVLCCSVLCCTVHCVVLCCIVLCCALCCAVLYCVVLCCVVLCCTVHCVLLCCVLFCCVFAIGGPTVHSVNSNELTIDALYQNVLTSVCASHVLVFGFMLQNYSRRFNLTQLVTPVSQTCIIRHGTDFGFIRLYHLQLWNTRIYRGIFILYTVYGRLGSKTFTGLL